MVLPTAALKTFHWKRYGRYKEFGPITTNPQQDHREDDTGIAILPETDNRAQPWRQLVEANMHNKKIRFLPSAFAERHEVQEFIYFVLAKSTSTYIKSVYITATVSRCPLNGITLRTLRHMRDVLALVPKVYTDVYKDTHEIPDEQRLWLAQRMYTYIRPLIESEQKANKDAAKGLRNLKLHEVKTEAKCLPVTEEQPKRSDKKTSVSPSFV
jgi:hypothetical protein